MNAGAGGLLGDKMLQDLRLFSFGNPLLKVSDQANIQPFEQVSVSNAIAMHQNSHVSVLFHFM
jgi:hypothetical protein